MSGGGTGGIGAKFVGAAGVAAIKRGAAVGAAVGAGAGVAGTGLGLETPGVTVGFGKIDAEEEAVVLIVGGTDVVVIGAGGVFIAGCGITGVRAGAGD